MVTEVMIVLGTRPEAIKLFPVYKALCSSGFKTILCATFQHDELLTDVFNVFGLEPDINLNVMRQHQDLFYLTQIILEKMKEVFLNFTPKLVLVQGDTTTAFAAALAAFYLHIPVGHVEAGLRSGSMQAPFPEEMNRKFVTQISNYHFAPTAINVGNLLSEGVDRKNIFCVGNTVVDAIYWMQQHIKNGKVLVNESIKHVVETCKTKNQKLVLLTAHRRESFGAPLTRALLAIKKFAQMYDDVLFFYPVHPNPSVTRAVQEAGLDAVKNIYLNKPVDYASLVYLISNASWVVTDSGGIQEEAVSIGKPVLVMREVTERVEAVWEGVAKLVGTDEALIYNEMTKLYFTSDLVTASLIYGDGKSSDRIISVLKTILQKEQGVATLQRLHHVFDDEQKGNSGLIAKGGDL